MSKNELNTFKLEKKTMSSSINMNSKIHVHNVFEMYYMLSGECRYFINDRVLTLNSNTLVLIPSGIPHRTVYVSEKCDRVLAFLSVDYINSLLLPELYRVFPGKLFAPNESQAKKMLEIFEKIEKEQSKNDAYTAEMIKAHMTEIFTTILRSGVEMEDSAYEKADIVIYDAVQYISAHCGEEITLKKISMRCAMSESSFSRTFKNVTGFGFKEYLSSVRMERAKQYLTNTDMSISEIAFMCGFNDSNYFSSFFSKANKISPLKFRKKNREEDIYKSIANS